MKNRDVSNKMNVQIGRNVRKAD